METIDFVQLYYTSNELKMIKIKMNFEEFASRFDGTEEMWETLLDMVSPNRMTIYVGIEDGVPHDVISDDYDIMPAIRNTITSICEEEE